MPPAQPARLSLDSGAIGLSKSDHTNHIAAVAVGQRVVPGAVTERTDHYRLLRTVEDLYGLPPLGNSAQPTAIVQLWHGHT